MPSDTLVNETAGDDLGAGSSGMPAWRARVRSALDRADELPPVAALPERARSPLVIVVVALLLVLCAWLLTRCLLWGRYPSVSAEKGDLERALPPTFKYSDSTVAPGRVKAFLRSPVGRAVVRGKKFLDIPLYFCDVGSDVFTTYLFFRAGHLRWATMMAVFTGTSWVAGFAVALAYVRVRFRFSAAVLLLAFLLAMPWGIVSALYLDLCMVLFAAFRQALDRRARRLGTSALFAEFAKFMSSYTVVRKVFEVTVEGLPQASLMVYIFVRHRSEYRLPLVALSCSVAFSVANLLATWIPILYDIHTKYEGQVAAYFLSEMSGGARVPVAELVKDETAAVSMSFADAPSAGEMALLRALVARNHRTRRFVVNGKQLPVREMLIQRELDVDLSERGLDDSHALFIAQALHRAPGVVSLRLDGNDLSPAAVSAVAAAAQVRGTVRTLNLTGLELPAAALRRAAPVVDFSGKGLRDTDAVAVAGLIAGNTTVRELWLSGNRIGDAGAKALAEVVRASPWVSTINLGGNEIGDDGAADIAQALRGHPGVDKVSLSYNKVGPAGAAAIAQALHGTRAVTHLDLDNNVLGDGGAIAIAETVATHPTLSRLYLSHNNVGSRGARAIADALTTNTALVQLYLDGNQPLEDDAREALRDAWRRNGRSLGLYL